MRTYKITAIAALMLAGTLAATAQNELSPYSKYGYGLLSDNLNTTQRAMGGVGYAMNNSHQINMMNPASYAMCDSLTFLWDIAFSFTNLWQKEDGERGYTFGGGLEYVNMQFPISKNMGASIGLMPFSEVGYSYAYDLDEGTESRTGDGGISQLYAGVAYRFFNLISLGVNVSYNFGSVTNDTYGYTESSSITQYEHVIEVQDWGINLGLQISKLFNRKHRLTLGLTYTPAKDLRGKAWGTYYNTTSDTSVDTVEIVNLKGRFSTPHMFGAGINYTYDNRVSFEADYSFQKWSSAKYYDIDLFGTTEFKDRHRAAVGMQIIPKHRGNFVQRTSYRLGANYTRDYISVRGEDLKEYGFGVGFGMPSMFTKTIINLGFEYKHREAKGYISENYFNITVGVTFDETWFWKNKLR